MENTVTSTKLANSLKKTFVKNGEKILWLKIQGSIQISIILTFIIIAYYFNIKNYNYTIEILEYKIEKNLEPTPKTPNTPQEELDNADINKDVSSKEALPSWKYKKIGFMMGIASMINIFSIIVMVVLLKNYRNLRSDIKNLQSEQDNFDKLISLLESQEFSVKLPDQLFIQRLFIEYDDNRNIKEEEGLPNLPPEVSLLLKEVLNKYMK